MNWDLMNFLATSALTIAIYWLQRSHEKEREQMEVEAQKKAVAEAARVFLIDNEDEIECLPLSAIAKSLNLKRKHHRAITTKFLRCSEEVQKEILKQANFQLIEVSKEQVSAALKRLKDDIKACGFGRDTLYDGAKYFHRAMERYSDEKIETVNPYIFEDIRRTHFYQGDSLRLLKDTSYNRTLYGYMYDYLHSADLGKSKCLSAGSCGTEAARGGHPGGVQPDQPLSAGFVLGGLRFVRVYADFRDLQRHKYQVLLQQHPLKCHQGRQTRQNEKGKEQQ